MSLGLISINSCPSIEARSQKELKPILKKSVKKISIERFSMMLDLFMSSGVVSNMGGLTMKENRNIFKEL